MECTLLFFIHELCGSETVREMKIYSIKGSPHTEHVFDLKMNKKINFGGKINFFNRTTIHQNKSPCDIRTQNLQNGRLKLHPLHHRDR